MLRWWPDTVVVDEVDGVEVVCCLVRLVICRDGHLLVRHLMPLLAHYHGLLVYDGLRRGFFAGGGCPTRTPLE